MNTFIREYIKNYYNAYLLAHCLGLDCLKDLLNAFYSLYILSEDTTYTTNIIYYILI